jgi:transposase-like protein
VCVSPPTPRCKKAVRPDPCRICGARSWWNGGRVVAEVIHELGQGARRVIDVLRQRARCSDRCCAAGSWTIYPADAYPHRSYQLDVVAAAVAEVCVGGGTRRAVAGHHECSRRSVSRWVRWTAQLARPEDLARLCARLDPEGLPPPTPATTGGEVSRAGAVLRLLNHLGAVLLRRGVTLPGRGPGLVRVLVAQRARFGDVAWLTRSSPPLRVAAEALPV